MAKIGKKSVAGWKRMSLGGAGLVALLAVLFAGYRTLHRNYCEAVTVTGATPLALYTAVPSGFGLEVAEDVIQGLTRARLSNPPRFEFEPADLAETAWAVPGKRLLIKVRHIPAREEVDRLPDNDLFEIQEVPHSAKEDDKTHVKYGMGLRPHRPPSFAF